MKILIAYDGSESSDAAIDDLRNAGLPASADVTLVTAMAPESGLSMADLGDAEIDIERSRLGLEDGIMARGTGMITAMFPDWSVTGRELIGSPADQILALATEWGADLIVVGSHGRNRLQRLLLGSVSLRVLRNASCTVRVGRRRSAPGRRPLRLMLAVDGSPHSDRAVRELLSRQWEEGTQVALVTICTPAGMIYSDDDITREQREEGRRNHERWMPVLQRRGLEVSCIIHEDDPSSRILYDARKWGADTIFIGARGRGAVASLLLGSVSSHVAESAHCTVEVVHLRDDRE